MSAVIKVENLSKQYRLGNIGMSSFRDDTKKLWATIKGNENPFENISSEDYFNVNTKSDYVWSLKDVSFQLEKGDVLGVIGRNGAGKSTLLKILSKITLPTTGSVKMKGRIASLLEVGTGFHPELTGRENIYLNGAILGMKKKEITRKLDEIISFAGISKYIDTPVKRYSSGMYVRLAFAVAAHLENEILVVDEVLAVGDAEFQKKCMAKMTEISSGQGRTIMFVSHNIVSIQNLCNKGLLLSNGQMKLFDNLTPVIDKYYSDFKTNSITSLKNREDRQGNKIVELIDFKINKKTIENGVKILCGDQLCFELEYNSDLEKFTGKFVIGIYDQYFNRVLFLDSSIIKETPIFFSKNGKISIILSNQFSLGIGEYSINIAIFVEDVISDYIQGITLLKVLDSDFYHSGKLPPSDTIILVNQQWKFNF